MATPTPKRGNRWKGGRVRTTNGYIKVLVDGPHPRKDRHGYVYEHVVVAEKALGHYMPDAAVVHHVNGDGTDNRPQNLVICEDQAYHLLLHYRADAYRATGDANKRWCWICQRYDDPQNVTASPGRPGQSYHGSCAVAREKTRTAARRIKRQQLKGGASDGA